MNVRSPLRLAMVPLTLGSLTGCLTETRTYSVSVRNDLATPVTICLTKANGPPEAGWQSPEDLIMPPHQSDEGVPDSWHLPPGRTAVRQNVEGDFDPNRGRAYLRVYTGEPTLAEMSAADKGSYNRLDVPLHPGPNNLVVTRGPGGNAVAVPAASIPTPAAKSHLGSP